MKRWAILVLLLAGCGGSKVSSCGTVRNDVLPPWARAGFSDAEPKIAHVMGANGSITAILFGQPLTSPPAPDHRDKILWVSRFPQSVPEDLHITADDGRRTVERVVPGGPGPSIINLPSAGCWRMSLAWGRHRDSLALRYVKP